MEIIQWVSPPSVMAKNRNRAPLSRFSKPAGRENTQKHKRPSIRPGDRLSLTLFLALMVHSMVILGVNFDPSDVSKAPPPSLEVLLVQMSTQEAPEAARYIAQVNQQASGSHDKEGRPSNPFMGMRPSQATGVAPISLQVNSEPSNTSQRNVITSHRDLQHKVHTPEHQDLNRDTDRLDKTRHASRRLEIARLSAELAASEKQYASQPRIHYLDTLSTKTAVEAQYIKGWVDKVERIGNLNYPDQARRDKLSGALILHVLLNKEGRVEEVQIGSSSGQQVLDDAAMRIIKLSAPFNRFPEGMRELYDKLMITRTWLFQAGDTFVTR